MRKYFFARQRPALASRDKTFPKQQAKPLASAHIYFSSGGKRARSLDLRRTVLL
jgi:hypothetical protein